MQNIVIAGAGHAGFQVAAMLRSRGFAGAVTLINNESHLPYQRPPLSKAFLVDGRVDRLEQRPESFYADQKIDLVAGTVVRIDRTRRLVDLAAGGKLLYEHLVLATGAATRRLTVPGAGTDIAYLDTVDAAIALRQRMTQGRRVVIVGAGFIGLEFAVAACKAGMLVTVVEIAGRSMQRAVAPEISVHFEAQHRARGVTFRFGASVASIARRDGAVSGVVLGDGSIVAADLVVAGIGVAPNIDLARAAGLACGRGVMVDAGLVTSDPAISAIGDCAEFPGPGASGAISLASVQNANDQARHVARRLTGEAADYAAVPWFWSDQGEDKLQIAGLSVGTDMFVRRGAQGSAAFSVFCFRQGQLIAVESVNAAADHMVARQLIGARTPLTPEQAASMSVDLRALAKAAR